MVAFSAVSVASAATYRFVTLEYPPYEYTEGGQVKGIVVDIIRETFKQMGHEVKIEVYSWGRSIEMFKRGEADGIFTFFKNPEREEFSFFSNEVVVAQPITLWVMKNSKIEFTGDLSKLNNYKFGVVKKTSYGEKFDNAVKSGLLKTDEADSSENWINKLAMKRFDIWVSNRYVALYELKRTGKSNDVKELSPAIQETMAYVVFSKKKRLEGLRDDFDKALANLKKSGKYDKIIKDYLKKI